jgi:branched-chain amino acid transport system substrate-binding protein
MRRCSVLLLCTIVLGGCADEGPPRIGVIVSTSPGRAAELAAGEQQPGERDYFEAVIAATTAPATGAEQAIEQAYAFVNDPRVLAVVGHANSASSLAASQIYNSAGLVQIAPTTTAPVFGEAGPFSFRLVPSDTLQAAYLSRAQRHHWPASRVAVVHVNDDYGRGLLRVLRPQLDSVVFEGLYADAADSSDVARLGTGIATSRADLLVWLGRPGTLGRLLPLLRPLLPDITVVCADACDVASVYRNGDGMFTGLFFVRFLDPEAPDSAIRAFQTIYRAQTGEVASSEALLTYDAVTLVRAALRAGARTRGDIREYLESLGTRRPAFEGLTGRIEFDASGAFIRTYMLAEVRADGVAPAAHTGHRYEK